MSICCSVYYLTLEIHLHLHSVNQLLRVKSCSSLCPLSPVAQLHARRIPISSFIVYYTLYSLWIFAAPYTGIYLEFKMSRSEILCRPLITDFNQYSIKLAMHSEAYFTCMRPEARKNWQSIRDFTASDPPPTSGHGAAWVSRHNFVLSCGNVKATC